MAEIDKFLEHNPIWGISFHNCNLFICDCAECREEPRYEIEFIRTEEDFSVYALFYDSKYLGQIKISKNNFEGSKSYKCQYNNSKEMYIGIYTEPIL